ncbi:MAG TPA: thioredoxin domain-containing protein [Acidimicrobiales bacterium]|nr:thioredoxin domain-containing protein [Acidimicrobiales bacterium]
MNRLATETSPYLRQHADNPVDWYPWGDEAFDLAREQDKPVFVSVGYASCHWCHVMAHESFEDPDVAADLGRWFVSVKVDREERPDVDTVYMAAVQAVTGSGGWPMSVFCTPDGRPFFGGTYFPPTDRHGMPAFRRVLAALAEAWRDRRDEVDRQADQLVRAVAADVRLVDRLAAGGGGGAGSDGGGGAGGPGGIAPSSVPAFGDVLDRTVAALAERFDPRWGGFGAAPKFPRPTLVELCLRHHRRTGTPRSLAMATTTLDGMAAGGMYDHLAGGFARYSTDDRWLVPHFEKMLTDQALLARAYLHGWQRTGNPDYLQVATETLDYVLDGLAGPTGGLCSSEDADAGGVEGGHATFTAAQAAEALAAAGRPDLVAAATGWYGITDAGNWEGTTVPCRPLGAPLRRPEEVEEARRILLAARRDRPQPSRDGKVLTEWNAMAVSALAEAAAATGHDRWAREAAAVAELLYTGLRRIDGRWLRCLGTDVAGFAADYAWLVDCWTRMGELTGQPSWTDRATEAADALLDLFWDDGLGGLFTTGRDVGALVVRGKDALDGAVPSANSVAAVALLRLAALTGADRFEAAGRRILELAAPLLAEHPMAVADLVAATSLAEGTTEVVVAGDRPDLLAVVRGRWLPDAVVAWGEPSASPLWAGRPPGAAYVCHRFTCQAPAADADTLAAQLDRSGPGQPEPEQSGA